MGKPLTVEEVAAITPWSKQTLYSRRCLGQGPPSYKIGHRVVWDSDELEAWLAAERQKTTRGAA